MLIETYFDAVYEDVAKGFVHVHHLRLLSRIACDYEVDPVHDLRPVCPNCHAVIHLGGEHRELEAVRQMLRLPVQLRQPVPPRQACVFR